MSFLRVYFAFLSCVFILHSYLACLSFILILRAYFAFLFYVLILHSYIANWAATNNFSATDNVKKGKKPSKIREFLHISRFAAAKCVKKCVFQPVFFPFMLWQLNWSSKNRRLENIISSKTEKKEDNVCKQKQSDKEATEIY